MNYFATILPTGRGRNIRRNKERSRDHLDLRLWGRRSPHALLQVLILLLLIVIDNMTFILVLLLIIILVVKIIFSFRPTPWAETAKVSMVDTLKVGPVQLFVHIGHIAI